MKLNRLLKRLLSLYFHPAMDENDGGEGDLDLDTEPEPEEKVVEEDETLDDDDQEPEPEPEEGDDAAAEPKGRANAAIREARRRAQDAEDRIKRMEADAEERNRQPVAPPPDRAHAEEEARLRDPDVSDLEKWQIQANRQLRENNRQNAMAMAQVQDMSDKSRFDALAVSKPVIHKRYADRVEAELNKMRKTGQNAPREAILRFLIGNDALEGKLSTKKSTGARKTGGVDRGRTPGARTDVQAKGRMTEHERLEKRLEGKII